MALSDFDEKTFPFNSVCHSCITRDTVSTIMRQSDTCHSSASYFSGPQATRLARSAEPTDTNAASIFTSRSVDTALGAVQFTGHYLNPAQKDYSET